jgi:hypothetical protein
MSTIKVNNIQIGQSGTATQNFVLSTPITPDGTIKLSRGNVGATTQDILTIGATGNITLGNNLNSSGLIFPQQASTGLAPAYVKGAIYFDTTLNKLRIGGASGWETITSS